MNKFYQHTLPQPFHISVGAALFNEKGEICVHHFFTKDLPPHLQFHAGGLTEYYHLMRESLEGDESLQSAVHRGIMEEFGAEGLVLRYLGAITCGVETPTKRFEKTTIYHAVRLTQLKERKVFDEESETVMEWHAPEALLQLFKEQMQKTDRPDLDETVVVERFIQIYGQH